MDKASLRHRETEAIRRNRQRNAFGKLKALLRLGRRLTNADILETVANEIEALKKEQEFNATFKELCNEPLLQGLTFDMDFDFDIESPGSLTASASSSGSGSEQQEAKQRAADDGMLMTMLLSPSMYVIDCNEATCLGLGKPKDQIIGESAFKLDDCGADDDGSTEIFFKLSTGEARRALFFDQSADEDCWYRTEVYRLDHPVASPMSVLQPDLLSAYDFVFYLVSHRTRDVPPPDQRQLVFPI